MKLPDGPKAPSFLQLLQAIAYPLERLEACAKRYGDTFTSRTTGFPPLVIFSHPQAIQEIFTADPNQFDSGKGMGVFQPTLGDNSLILLDSDRHLRQRRLLMPPFHGERMRAYSNLICETTETAMNQWTIGEPFFVLPSMLDISLRVILQAVFGINEGERFQQLRQFLRSLLDLTGSPLRSSLVFIRSLQRDLGPWSPWGRFLRLRQQIDELIYAEIRQRRAEMLDVTSVHSREDILTLLLAARDEAGEPMTDVELRDELMTLLVAGHETTAAAVTWALHWTHRLPEVGEKLIQELNTLGCDKDPTAIARLPYLNAVCQETLRIYPVALFAFTRIVRTPIEIAGYQFEPGTVLAPCIYLTHQREDLYPEPKRFKPERFLERQFSPYEYLPFGGGNRRCIGMAFAQLEMKLVLATILSHFHLKLVDNRPVKPVRRAVLTAPPRGMQMVVTGVHRSQNALIPV